VTVTRTTSTSLLPLLAATIRTTGSLPVPVAGWKSLPPGAPAVPLAVIASASSTSSSASASGALRLATGSLSLRFTKSLQLASEVLALPYAIIILLDLFRVANGSSG